MSRRYLLLTGAVIACAYALLLVAPAEAQIPGFRSKTASMEEQKRLMEAKARETLKAHEWTVYLTAKNANVSGETDVYVFGDGTMESKGLTAKGYPVSNITITANSDSSIVWETMKTTSAKDKAFYRGELRNGVMSGMVVMKPVKGAVSTFSFTTAPAQAAPDQTPAVLQSGAGTAAPVDQTNAPAKKKKK